MLELFSYSFMLRALAASVIIGATCSLVGVFVVLRSLSFIGAGIAHAAFAGVALAFLVGVNPLAMGIAFALIMVLLVGVISEQADLKLDASVGILFAFTMALALLFIGFMRQYNAELFGYLFGNVLSVTGADLWAVGVVSAIVLLGLKLFFKEFQFISFDSVMAEATGIPTRPLLLLLLTLVALTIVISLKAVGELMVVALIIIPASTAFQLTHSLGKMMWLSVAFGVIASVCGLVVSFYLDVPSGPAIVILLSLCFGAAAVFSPRRRCKPVADEVGVEKERKRSGACAVDEKVSMEEAAR